LGLSLMLDPPLRPAAQHFRRGYPVATADATNPPLQLARLQCPSEADAVLLSEVLLEAGALYVSLEDADAGSDAEVPIFAVHPPGAPDGTHVLTQTPGKAVTAPSTSDETLESWEELMTARKLWSNAALEVGFAADADVESALLFCAATAGIKECPRFSITTVGQRDWVSEVQSNWPPVVLPGCLCIRFPWHTDADVAALALDEAPPHEVVLHPGMAFGTGEHATTQLCCEALKRFLQGGAAQTGSATLLDYGSGSGVLAFAALLFGAEHAVGVEIDPQALVISRLNARENGLGSSFEAMLPEEESARDAAYPLVVANILAGTLIELQPLLVRRVEAGGTLLLSGIWGQAQADKVIDAFAGEMSFGPPVTRNGWVLLQGTR